MRSRLDRSQRRTNGRGCERFHSATQSRVPFEYREFVATITAATPLFALAASTALWTAAGSTVALRPLHWSHHRSVRSSPSGEGRWKVASTSRPPSGEVPLTEPARHSRSFAPMASHSQNTRSSGGSPTGCGHGSSLGTTRCGDWAAATR